MPKNENKQPSNTEKNPDDWTTGGEPMTGAQASYLHTLADQAHEPEVAADDLTKAEASKRIEKLREDAGLASAGSRKSASASSRKSATAGSRKSN